VNCGEVVEPGILRHRFAQPSRFARFMKRLTARSPKTWEVVPLGA
jgi:hypothetical protein